MADVHISADDLTDFVTTIFEHTDCSAAEARRVAENLVEANLTGHDSHGVVRVLHYVQWLAHDVQHPDRDIEVTMDGGAMLLIDGEAFRMKARDGDAQIRTGAAERPDIVMTTSYEPLMALADGEMDEDTFLSKHVDVDVRTPGKQAEFFDLLARAMREFE